MLIQVFIEIKSSSNIYFDQQQFRSFSQKHIFDLNPISCEEDIWGKSNFSSRWENKLFTAALRSKTQIENPQLTNRKQTFLWLDVHKYKDYACWLREMWKRFKTCWHGLATSCCRGAVPARIWILHNKHHTPNTAQKPNIKQHRPNTAQRLNTNTKNFTNTTIQTSNKQTKQQRQKTNTKTKPNNKHQTLHAQHLNISASLQKVPNINRKHI